MRRGCCFGCLVRLSLLAAVFFGAGYLIGRTGLIDALPPAATSPHLGGAPILQVYVDVDSSQASGVLTKALDDVPGWALSPFLPYEACFNISHAGPNESIAVDFALSLRRGGWLVASRIRQDRFLWWPGQEIYRVSEESPGLVVGRSHVPLGAPLTSPVFPPRERPAFASSPGAFPFEIRIDNGRGDASAILAQLFFPRQSPEPGKEALWQGLTLSQFTRSLDALDWGWLGGATAGQDRIDIAFEIKCRVATNYSDVLAALARLHAHLSEKWLDEGVLLAGEFKESDGLIRGTFHVTRYEEVVAESLRDYFTRRW